MSHFRCELLFYSRKFRILVRDHGISGVEPDSPRLKSVDYSPNTAVLTFNVSRLGLNPNLKDLPGFELAGDDKVFYPAKIMKISLWFLLISIIFTSLMLMANHSSS